MNFVGITPAFAPTFRLSDSQEGLPNPAQRLLLYDCQLKAESVDLPPLCGGAYSASVGRLVAIGPHGVFQFPGWPVIQAQRGSFALRRSGNRQGRIYLGLAARPLPVFNKGVPGSDVRERRIPRSRNQRVPRQSDLSSNWMAQVRRTRTE